jgi:hypothetical protein
MRRVNAALIIVVIVVMILMDFMDYDNVLRQGTRSSILK